MSQTTVRATDAITPCRALDTCLAPHARIHAAAGWAAVFKFMQDNAEQLDSSIVYDRDMAYDFFAFKVRCRPRMNEGGCTVPY